MTKPYPTPQDVIDTARFILRKHYCENDVEPIIDLMDEDIVWMGAAEDGFSQGREKVAQLFRQFTGPVPPCPLSGEELQAWAVAPGCTWWRAGCGSPPTRPPASACGPTSG